ncbi:MAG TPA: glycosyltransferase family 2 protein [Xanthobacteraceae bacterium]|nr:glycosyltransferase family 2 protein [Xanthobacteraceae bacterium]
MIDCASESVTFVVPCYNERDSIVATIAEIEATAQEIDLSQYEILVVDDCSSDDTSTVVATLLLRKSHLKLIRNPVNLNLGGAYKEGVRHAHGTYVIMVPGDNSHPYDGIVPILRKAGEADIVVPYVANPRSRPWRRRLASSAFTFLVNRLFGLDLPYFNGLVLHRTRLLQRIEIKTNSFAYQAEALVRLISGGATYCTVPVNIAERAAGHSSAFAPKNIYRVVKTILLLWRDVYRGPKQIGWRSDP